MTTVRTPSPSVLPAHRTDGRNRARSGRRLDRAFSGLTLTAGLTILATLVGVVLATATFAWPAFRAGGIGFFTGTTWSSQTNTFGALPMIYGTVVTAVIAIILAVPASLGVALFLTEVCPRRLRGPIVALIDLLAAIPSVVFGLVGVLAFHNVFQTVFRAITGPKANGSSLLTAGIILAFMIIPIITSISREVIATVPGHHREASYALGATRWEVLRTAILPAGSGGITGAVMLGLGRALGETIAVALVVGSAIQITPDITQPGTTMAEIIANRFNGEGMGIERNALMGLGVVLFMITIAVNVAARVVVNRAQRRNAGT